MNCPHKRTYAVDTHDRIDCADCDETVIEGQEAVKLRAVLINTQKQLGTATLRMEELVKNRLELHARVAELEKEVERLKSGNLGLIREVKSLRTLLEKARDFLSKEVLYSFPQAVKQPDGSIEYERLPLPAKILLGEITAALECGASPQGEKE